MAPPLKFSGALNIETFDLWCLRICEVSCCVLRVEGIWLSLNLVKKPSHAHAARLVSLIQRTTGGCWYLSVCYGCKYYNIYLTISALHDLSVQEYCDGNSNDTANFHSWETTEHVIWSIVKLYISKLTSLLRSKLQNARNVRLDENSILAPLACKLGWHKSMEGEGKLWITHDLLHNICVISGSFRLPTRGSGSATSNLELGE